MPAISEIYKHLSQKLSELEARIILKERAEIAWSDIIANPDREIDTETILKDLTERQSGKPLSRIYGTREFWGLPFNINEHTLDPRPDSEILIEAAMRFFETQDRTPKSILDLGTGTGCLLLSLLHEYKAAQGKGIDISKEALNVAKHNAKSFKLDDRTSFVHGSWDSAKGNQYDLIIANPPYIESKVIPTLEKEVKNHDPIQALDGGEDGLQAYKDIFSLLPDLLKDDGFAIVEIGFDQAEKVMRLSEKQGLKAGELYRDLAGNPRAVDIFKKKNM